MKKLSPLQFAEAIEKIDQMREELNVKARELLRRQGWEYRCDFPGSLWLFVKKLPDGRLVCCDQSAALNIEENLY
jgi:hypothetical protein